MAKTKKVAETLTTILENPTMKAIMDRNYPIDNIIGEVVSWWRYDMSKRKPGPAYINDEYVGTDLDLACFLFELAERNAVINIPQYKGMRGKTLREGEVVLSSDNRHGQIIGLTANKNVFSFSIRIKDMNVVNVDGVGEYRNFSITDLDGDWYEGFKNLGFIPTAKENKFLLENDMVVDNKIDFTTFVHPNRWSSMFGQHYFITKALLNRVKEEAGYYYKEIKAMLDEGVKYPVKDEPKEWPKTEKGETKKIKVLSFEVDLEYPDNDTKYPEYKHTKKNLVELTNKRNYLLYNVSSKLTFALRTVEYAYHKFGHNRLPAWLKNVDWEEGYTEKGKRTKWDRVILFQPEVGKTGVSIKKRLYETTQEVAIGYDNRKGKLKNYVGIVLDESGSMGTIIHETISAFNEQIQVIKDNSHDMDTSVSLVTFSYNVHPKFLNKSEMSLKPLDCELYSPHGLTALNDAIAYTIEQLNTVEDKDDPNTSFLLVVITDGEENYSKKYPGMHNKNLAKLIKEVQDTKRWTITFLGANQDVEKYASVHNISAGNAASFNSTKDGMEKASFTVTRGLTSYYNSRRDGLTHVDSFYDDSTKKD